MAVEYIPVRAPLLACTLQKVLAKSPSTSVNLLIISHQN